MPQCYALDQASSRKLQGLRTLLSLCCCLAGLGGGVAVVRNIRGTTAVRVARRADRCVGCCGLNANQNAVNILVTRRVTGASLSPLPSCICGTVGPARTPPGGSTISSTQGAGAISSHIHLRKYEVVSQGTVSVPGRWCWTLPTARRSAGSPDKLAGSSEVTEAVDQAVSSPILPAAPSPTSPAAVASSLCSHSCSCSSSPSGSPSSPAVGMPPLGPPRIPNELRSED